MLEDHGIPVDEERAFRRKRDARYIEGLEREVAWIGPAERILREVAAARPVAVITASWRSYVDAIDRRLGLYGIVPVVVSNEEFYSDGKRLGLALAARRLEVDPADCVYVGDLPFDMRAARDAGMPGWLVPGSYTPDEARALASRVFPDLTALREHLG